jgi:hypothetical protein
MGQYDFPKTRTSAASLPIQQYRLITALGPRKTRLTRDFMISLCTVLTGVRSPTHSYCLNVLRKITSFVVRQYTSSAASVSELPVQAPFSTEEKAPR